MERPRTFDDIVGHPWLVTFLTNHIEKGTLPHFIILEGAEGLGKTSLADITALSLVYGLAPSPTRDKSYEDVVVHGTSNDNIKRFKCSVDGGKDVARVIKDEMNNTFVIQGPKVIICDECHGFSPAAQDVFLSETEFIDKNVYLIMLTTEVSKLKASLRSRALVLHLDTLKTADMITVLRKEVAAKNLHLQNADAILSMIAEWAECKPRTGLQILNAFADGESVSTNTIQELIGFMDVRDLVPLLSSLSGSMTFGLSYISEMKINDSILSNVIECINVKTGTASYKLKMKDVTFVREQLQNVTTEQLIEFLYGITKHPQLTRADVINAFIGAHNSRRDLYKENTKDALAIEQVQRANIELQTERDDIAKAPSLDDLLLDSKIIN